MAHEKKTKVALIRGNSLNEWEGKIWSLIQEDFSVTGFSSKKNLYDSTHIGFPVKKMSCTTDNKIIHVVQKYVHGIFQKMHGLEKELHHFDIAHTAEISYFLTNQAVRAKKKNPRLKVVTTIWDNSFGRFEYNYWSRLKMPPAYWRNKINKNIQENIAGVDMFLPVTKYSAEFLCDLGVSESKIKILTPAVIIEQGVDKKDTIKNFLIQNYSFDIDNKKIFLMVNRLVKEKGVYDVLYAWKMFCNEHKDRNSVLMIVGNGREQTNIKRLVSEFGIDNHVIFVNHIPNSILRHLYAHAYCLILGSIPNPLWQEQFGFVLAEAIINNCPVISTYSGAIPEVIDDAGILVPPLNPVALKNALKYISRESTYQDLKEQCGIVSRKFMIEKYVDELSDIYRSLSI